MLKAERRGTVAARQRLAALARAARPGLEAARSSRLDQDVLITPDIRAVRDEASAQMVNREAMFGIKAQLQVGEGAEFEALADYRQGMDRRAIDWKQSARHTALIAKEYRTERNNNIVMALDAGRAMCEPVDGVPRIDRAVSAALLTAFVALEGRRPGRPVRLRFAAARGEQADRRRRAPSRCCSGSPRASTIRRARPITRSALATLAAGFSRRSLIVVFTEFADTISAELMLNAVGTLLKRHLVLFVVLRDEELEAFAAAEPAEPDDVSRAVTAAALLRERRLVLTRLRHLGVHVVEARGGRGRAGSGQRLSRPQAAEPAVTAHGQFPPLPRRPRGRMAAARGHPRPAPRSARCARSSDEELLALAGPLSRRPLLAVGGARDLARPRARHLSRRAVRARLFLRLRRAHLGLAAGSAPSSRATGRRRCAGLWRETLASLAAHPDRRARRLSARDAAIRAGSTASSRRSWPAAAISAPRPSTCAATLYDDAGASGLSTFADLLFTHNSQVAILAFALGFAFGVPTALLLIYNGAMLGAFLASVRRRAGSAWSWAAG